MLEFELDNEDKLIEILKKCTDCYTNTTDLYELNNEDIKIINVSK